MGENVMKIEKRIHRGWIELKKMREIYPDFTQFIGKYRYVYSNEKGCISLIELANYLMDGRVFWEIFCVEGTLFEDVERFDTKEHAEKRIGELLDEKVKQ